MSKRVALRNKLKCKGFDWYLKNIFPESVMVTKMKKIGQIQKAGSKFCIDRLGRKLNRQIGIYKCHGHGTSQAFAYLSNHQIVFHHSECLSLAQKESFTMDEINRSNAIDSFNMMFDTNPNEAALEDTANHVVLLKCNGTNGEKWSYNESVRS